MKSPSLPSEPPQNDIARELEIIAGQRPVLIGQRTIVVREMNWIDASSFLSAVGLRLGDRLGFSAGSRDIQITPQLVVEVLTKHCAAELVAATTDVAPADFEKLPALHAFQLLEAAIAMNFHPEMIQLGKAVAARLGAAWKASA